MKKRLVIFKAKEPNEEWANARIVRRYRFVDAGDARAAALAVAQFIGKEIRWNWEGSYQGHYVKA